jgi:hypothetical protein
MPKRAVDGVPPGYRHTFRDGVHVLSDPDVYGQWIYVVPSDGAWRYQVRLEDVDGVPQITGLHLERRDRGGVDLKKVGNELRPIPAASPAEAVITSRALQAVPLTFLARVAAAHRAGNQPTVRDALAGFRGGRPKVLPDEHFEAVAQVYLSALQRREPPLKAVGTHFGVKRAMASRYVQRARELQFLGWPEKHGVAGASRPDSPITKGV